ncbi:sensor histidine kinase [Fulvitalea axinellae]|uniref:histidine kinase n=1 Tax=Fulvitalea axinellae TaxID=1182444 RepID=A0AAU9DIU6_9BACT|nr:sensor histidine kinase [Fulvitalea axinellae]
MLIFLAVLVISGTVMLQAHWLWQAYAKTKEQFATDVNAALAKAGNSGLESAIGELKTGVAWHWGNHNPADLFPSANLLPQKGLLPKRNLLPKRDIKTGITREWKSKEDSLPTNHFKIPSSGTHPKILLRKLKKGDSVHRRFPRIKIEKLDKGAMVMAQGTGDLNVTLRDEDTSILDKGAGYVLKISDTSPDGSMQQAIVISLDGASRFDAMDSVFRQEVERLGLPKNYHLGYRGPDSWLAGTPLDSGQYDRVYSTMITLFGGDRHLKATFPGEQRHIISQISLNVLASVLLTVTLVACLVWMLRVIHQQKTLAEIKDDFIGNMTHELKTPIAITQTALEAMKNFDALNDPDKTTRYLDAGQREMKRLTLLVDKIMRLSLEEKRELKLEKEPLDVAQFIEKHLQSFRATNRAEINFANGLQGAHALADPFQFSVVLQNLLENAVKYSDGHPKIDIALTATADNTLKLSVRDQGVGMDERHLSRIFDKFYRIPQGDQQHARGYGLGLYQVMAIVNAHGWEISVKSAKGVGSQFNLTLPAYEQDPVIIR